jgi:hypothetical protein
VALPFIGFFGDHGKEVQVVRGHGEAGFLVRFPHGTLEGRLAGGGFEFSADRAPDPEVRWFRPQQEQLFARGVFEKHEDGDFVGEGLSRHRSAGGRKDAKVTRAFHPTTLFPGRPCLKSGLERRFASVLGERPSRRSSEPTVLRCDSPDLSITPNLSLRPLAKCGASFGETVITVRKASSSDVALVLSYLEKKALFDRQLGCFSGAFDASVERIARALFGAPVFAHAWLATSGVMPVGMAFCHFQFSSFQARPSLKLDDLYVDSNARRGGTGLGLLSAVSREAASHECTHLAWTRMKKNSLAFHFSAS